jgi:hypothetical protein
MAKFLESYTLCTPDCEGGHHVPRFIRCERCGAETHKRVYKVEDDHGMVYEVGSNCFADIMGYRFGKSHEKAIILYEYIMEHIDRASKRDAGQPLSAYMDMRGYATVTLPCKGYRDKTIIVKTEEFAFPGFNIRVPFNLSWQIVRAGNDLGLWTMIEYQRPAMELTLTHRHVA